jgi:hypothetical protein
VVPAVVVVLDEPADGLFQIPRMIRIARSKKTVVCCPKDIQYAKSVARSLRAIPMKKTAGLSPSGSFFKSSGLYPTVVRRIFTRYGQSA